MSTRRIERTTLPLLTLGLLSDKRVPIFGGVACAWTTLVLAAIAEKLRLAASPSRRERIRCFIIGDSLVPFNSAHRVLFGCRHSSVAPYSRTRPWPKRRDRACRSHRPPDAECLRISFRRKRDRAARKHR